MQSRRHVVGGGGGGGLELGLCNLPVCNMHPLVVRVSLSLD